MKKQSYESNADVQRWLRRQAAEHDGADAPFEPTFLGGRHDRDWILSSLTVFYQQRLIVDVIGQASSGKEATVYCCLAHPDAGGGLLAAKVYRPRMFRNLRNDAIYRESRAQLDERGRAGNDRRQRRAAGARSERARELQVASWIAYEYQVQRALYAAGATVPRPWSQAGNAILMDWVGDEAGPAPRLSDVSLAEHEARPLFDALIGDVGLWLAHHRIHGDLSPYNILYHGGAATVIDFAQAVDPRHNPQVYPLLERDVERLWRFFARYGVAADPQAIAADLWTRYMLGELTEPVGRSHVEG
ncbi:MAG TPA: RIO1 family regulatory kinase/ATPase [Roseiflexaceae bacterium]|nr:RIO1 family regulatory kinase/ATPase [Roseiflexaceae bacterium]